MNFHVIVLLWCKVSYLGTSCCGFYWAAVCKTVRRMLSDCCPIAYGEPFYKRPPNKNHNSWCPDRKPCTCLLYTSPSPRDRQDRQTDNGPIAQDKRFYKQSPKNEMTKRSVTTYTMSPSEEMDVVF